MSSLIGDWTMTWEQIQNLSIEELLLATLHYMQGGDLNIRAMYEHISYSVDYHYDKESDVDHLSGSKCSVYAYFLIGMRHMEPKVSYFRILKPGYFWEHEKKEICDKISEAMEKIDMPLSPLHAFIDALTCDQSTRADEIRKKRLVCFRKISSSEAEPLRFAIWNGRC